jgi:hypothetical protein
VSNRSDYSALARELAEMFDLKPSARDRIETELHNAHVAGLEGSACECDSCIRILKREMELGLSVRK